MKDNINIKFDKNQIKELEITKNDTIYFTGDKLNVYSRILDLSTKSLIKVLISVINDKCFRRGRLKGSMYDNELYLLSEDKGFYLSRLTIVLCDVIKLEREDRIVYAASNLNPLKDFKEIKEFSLEHLFNKDEQKFKEIIEKVNSKTYYEVDTSQEKVTFYIESGRSYVRVEGSEEGLNVQFGDYSIDIPIGQYNKGIESIILNKQEEILELGITKLENGYLLNNKYYETLEELLKDDKR